MKLETLMFALLRFQACHLYGFEKYPKL
jgi:hypothetical protein